MRIAWVLADDTVLDHTVDVEKLKTVGSIWGSWRTWRGCSTDNVICNDDGKARDLLMREFNKLCNFYIPRTSFVDLDRPAGVNLFEGVFTFDVNRQDELIALHLAASQNDIVLLMGFDWKQQPKNPDRLAEHLAQNYRSTVKHAIKDNPQVQWVLIDHPETLMSELKNLDNLTQDSLTNVLEMLSA